MDETCQRVPPQAMQIHQLKTELWLPHPLDTVFPFFADARNLGAITPPWVHFRILTQGEIEMRPGALIDYRIKLHGVPVRWRTEIRDWDPPHRFVDQQLRGPYRQWVHEHRFTERDGGTFCEDIVNYAVPGGALVHKFFVRSDVERIFEYRQAKLREIFAKPASDSPSEDHPEPARVG